MNNFKDCIYKVESALIAKALREANGSVSRAARMLGFNHHGQLQSVMRRHPETYRMREPVRKRRRSIIRETPRSRETGAWHREAL